MPESLNDDSSPVTPLMAAPVEVDAATTVAHAPLTVRKIEFQRFKQFNDTTIELRPGVSLVAGGNNSGKTSLLHGLAVWEFCRTATLMEKGAEGLLPDETNRRQGFGLGDDQFSPINVPSLKHLWTNLKTTHERDTADKGYNLRLTCEWDGPRGPMNLGFGLALVNDRLFIKTASSNLQSGDETPRVAYLPPFAGITAREERISGAIRRRRIGEGLAGAVLRNLLLDLQQANQQKRSDYRSRPGQEGKKRTKISDADLRHLRENDPWELLLNALRGVFNAELIVKDFREEYHTYIEVLVDKGTVDSYKLKRYNGYNPRDLMVEGSGFLQWLSVYTLATSPDSDVLLFDEPDAHLHPTLQQEMLEQLSELARSTGKQVLLATHSSEILRSANPEHILQIKKQSARYLSEHHQKVGLLAGLGSDYAPKIDRIRRTKKVLFIEGTSDATILKTLATTAGVDWPEDWIEWCTTGSHKERKNLWLALNEDIPGLTAISLRDRDEEPVGTVGEELEDRNFNDIENFKARKWRRRYIEAHLLWPATLAEVSNKSEVEIVTYLQDKHGIAIGSTFTDRDAPQALLEIRAKDILQGLEIKAVDVARSLPPAAVCDDVMSFLTLLTSV